MDNAYCLFINWLIFNSQRTIFNFQVLPVYAIIFIIELNGLSACGVFFLRCKPLLRTIALADSCTPHKAIILSHRKVSLWDGVA